jgi:Nucleotidyltransferase domain
MMSPQSLRRLYLARSDEGEDVNYFKDLKEFAKIVVKDVLAKHFDYDNGARADIASFVEAFERGRIGGDFWRAAFSEPYDRLYGRCDRCWRPRRAGPDQIEGLFRRARSKAAKMIATRKKAIEELRRIVLAALGEHDAAVWLFGSCARGEVRQHSDIDIAIRAGRRDPAADLYFRGGLESLPAAACRARGRRGCFSERNHPSGLAGWVAVGRGCTGGLRHRERPQSRGPHVSRPDRRGDRKHLADHAAVLRRWLTALQDRAGAPD